MTPARRLFALVVLATACRREPPPPGPDTPEGALWRLREALAAGSLDDALVDTALVAQAQLLARMRRIHDMQEGHARAVTDDGWRALLDDLDREERPARALRRWAPLLPLLGDGRCVRERDADVPEALRTQVDVADEWPPTARALHASVSARVARVNAAVYRCAQGGRVTAVTAGDGGARRVVSISDAH